MNLSRRDFIQGAAALGAYPLVVGCGAARAETTQSIDSLVEGGIDGHAAARQQAVRLNPPDPQPMQSWRAGDFVLKANVGFPGVALNYDDGPSPYNTEPILRTLASYGVKATFYVVGVNAIAWPHILRRIRDEGHEIGNHSYLHYPYYASALASQVSQNQKVVADLAGVIMVSARAPGLTRGQIYLDACRQNNVYEVHTTIDSGDWTSPRISAWQIQQNILRRIHWGAIPLQHDGGNRRPTPAAQDGLIRTLLGRGYLFETVTDLINRGAPNPGTPYYSSLRSSRLAADVEADIAGHHESESVAPLQQDGVACNYDPASEMNRRLSEIEDTVPTRSERLERDSIHDALAVLQELT